MQNKCFQINILEVREVKDSVLGFHVLSGGGHMKVWLSL